MKTSTFFFTIFNLIGFCSGFSLLTSETKKPLTSGNILLEDRLRKALIQQILKDVISGPLRGQRVTLVIPKDYGIEANIIENVIRAFDTPVSILTFARQIPKELGFNLDISNFSLFQATQENGIFNNTEYVPTIHLKHSVAVILLDSEDDFWWPLWFPPKGWSAKSVLLVSTRSNSAGHHLQAPILKTASSVALICPQVSRRASASGVSFMVWTWLPFASGRKLVSIGTWKPESFQLWEDLFHDRFTDMTTKTLTILGNSEDRPLIYTSVEGAPRGLNLMIMKALSKWLGFHFEQTLGGNVLWTTITDSILRGENDLMINYATLTPERNDYFDLSVPYYYEGFGIILEVPPPLPQWQNVLYPFSWQVWAATGVSLLLSSFAYHGLYRRQENSLIVNAITVSQSLMSNPLAKVPSQWRIRNFLYPWWMLSFILNLSYTCNLIAVLTVPVFPKRIQSALELAESNYRLCMLDYGEFVPEALATSTHSTLAALGRKLDMVPLLDYMEDIGQEACIERVLGGSHGHTETYSYVKILYSKLGHNPSVYSLKEQLYPGYLAFLIKKYAPWKFKFDIGMRRLLEAGLVGKWYKESMEEFKVRSREDTSSTSELKPLSIGHLQGPFLLLLFGLFLALLFMAGEVTLGPPNK